MSGDGPLAQLYNRLRRDYRHHRTAQALYFKPIPSSVKGTFRFETNMGWEFAQDWYVGPDPEGDHFYQDGYFDSGGKLNPHGDTQANFYTEVFTDQGEAYVHITFYAPDGSGVLGEFVAKDEFGRATEAGFNGTTDSAYWRKVQYDEYECTVTKSSGDTLITIKKSNETVKVEVNSSTSDKIYNEAINEVDGKLYVKNRSTVATEGPRVRWYSEHAIFYSDWNGKEFAAFFYPYEGSNPKPLGSHDGDYRWDNVRWSFRG